MEATLQSAHLAACARLFAEADERFERLVAGVDEGQANWRPAPGRWSVGECLDHLNAAAQAYLPRMETAIARGRTRGLAGAGGAGRGPWAGRLLLAAVDPRRRPLRKVRAPEIFRPAGGSLDFARVCEGFRCANGRFAELMAAADGLDLQRVRLSSPVSALVRVSLAQVFEIHALHELRHLEQARRVTLEEGFPDRR